MDCLLERPSFALCFNLSVHGNSFRDDINLWLNFTCVKTGVGVNEKTSPQLFIGVRERWIVLRNHKRWSNTLRDQKVSVSSSISQYVPLVSHGLIPAIDPRVREIASRQPLMGCKYLIGVLGGSDCIKEQYTRVEFEENIPV